MTDPHDLFDLYDQLSGLERITGGHVTLSPPLSPPLSPLSTSYRPGSPNRQNPLPNKPHLSLRPPSPTPPPVRLLHHSHHGLHHQNIFQHLTHHPVVESLSMKQRTLSRQVRSVSSLSKRKLHHEARPWSEPLVDPSAYFRTSKRASIVVPMQAIEETLRPSIDLPEHGQQALREFYIRQRIKAIRTRNNNLIMRRTLLCLLQNARYSHTSRESMKLAFAHYAVASSRRLLDRWVSVTLSSAAQRRNFARADIVCARNAIRFWHEYSRSDSHYKRACLRSAMSMWRTLLIRRSELARLSAMADNLLTTFTLRRSFVAFRAFLAYSRKLRKAVEFFSSSSLSKAFSQWCTLLDQNRKLRIASIFLATNTMSSCFRQWLLHINELRNATRAARLHAHHTQVWAFSNWTDYVSVARRLHFAKSHFMSRLLSASFQSWLSYLSFALQYKDAVAHHCSSLSRRFLTKWKLYILHRRQHHELMATASLHYDQRLLSLSMSRLASYMSISCSRKDKLALALSYFNNNTLRKYFVLISVHTVESLKTKRATSHYVSASYQYYFFMLYRYANYRIAKQSTYSFCDSHFRKMSFNRLIRALEDNRRHCHRQTIHARNAEFHFFNRCLSKFFNSWIYYTNKKLRAGEHISTAKGHYREVVSHRFISALISNLKRRRKQRRRFQKSSLHHDSVRLKEGLAALMSNARDTRARRKKLAVSMAFYQLNLSSAYFKLWKSFVHGIRRRLLISDTMYEAFQVSIVNHFFERWVGVLLSRRRIRTLISKWHISTSHNRLIRRTAAWWRNGTLSRCYNQWSSFVHDQKKIRRATAAWLNTVIAKCFAAWRTYTGESKMLKRQKQDDASSHYIEFRLRLGFSMLRKNAKTRIGTNMLIKKALGWWNGNLELKMLHNWKTFVHEQRDMKRAVNMWRMLEEKKFWWRWGLYVENRRAKREAYLAGEQLHAQTLLRKGIHRLGRMISQERKQSKRLLKRAVLMFQGNVLYRIFIQWTDFVVMQKRMRKAAAIFKDGLLLRCFTKLSLYVQHRKDSRARKNLGDGHFKLSLMYKGFSGLELLISNDRKEHKRRLATSVNWFVDSLRMRCMGRWIDFVKECRLLRSAVAMFKNGLVLRCLRRWQLYVETRLEKRDKLHFAANHFERVAKSRAIKILRETCEARVEWKLHLASAMGWLKNSIAKRCMMRWRDFVETQKKMRYALGIFNKSELVKCMYKLKLYVYRRKEKRKLLEMAERHHRGRQTAQSFDSFVERVHYAKKERQLLDKARAWFGDILIYRCFKRWVADVEEIKVLRKAVLMFTDSVRVKCFKHWVMYVDERLWKKHLIEKARDHWSRVATVRALRILSESAESIQCRKRLLAKARAWFSDILMLRCFKNWIAHVNENMMLRKAVMMFTDAVRVKCFKKWVVYLDERITKKELLRKGEDFFNNRTLKQAFHKILQRKRRQKYRRDVYGVSDSFFAGIMTRSVFRALTSNMQQSRNFTILAHEHEVSSCRRRILRTWSRKVQTSKIDQLKSDLAVAKNDEMCKRRVFTRWSLAVDCEWRRQRQQQ